MLLTIPQTVTVDGWVRMGTVMLAIYVLFKSVTWVKARSLKTQFGWRGAAYLLAWPGMNFRAFLDAEQTPAFPRAGEWTVAVLHSGIGVYLVWQLSPELPHPALRGWVGMVGIFFTLNIGLLRLLSLGWRGAGASAPALWNTPLRARSVGSFWARHWNLAFHDFVSEFVFRPLARSRGAGFASLATFLVSGFIHELVLSVPVGGGYGLPTAYFVLQGGGVLIERSSFGRALGLRHGLLGWLFTILVVAGPAFWLFHPTFVSEVVLPFLDDVGAGVPEG